MDFARWQELDASERIAVEECVLGFSRVWHRTALPAPVYFVATLPPRLRGRALVELLKLDLDFRWRSAIGCLVDDFLTAWPELTDDTEILEELVEQEVRVRTLYHEPPELDELERRFPGRPLLIDVPGLRAQADERRERESFDGQGRFFLVRQLGAGGMGVVYEALDREHRTRVAIKSLTQVQPQTVLRFKQEFRALQELAHPNLVSLFELVSDGRQWFFTMELIDGLNFLAYLRPPSALEEDAASHDEWGDESTVIREDKSGSSGSRRLATGTRDSPAPPGPAVHPADGAAESRPAHAASGRAANDRAANERADDSSSSDCLPAHIACLTWTPLRLARLRNCLRQLVKGLDALHQAGKLHRDVKPSNVLVTTDERVVLLDFGLVTTLRRHGERARPLRGLDIGSDPVVAGTAAYMSPEQVQAEPLTSASDWYAVGVMLYQVLCGQLPFSGTPREILAKKLVESPPPPNTLALGVPDRLNSLCLALLARNPAERPTGERILRLLLEDEPADTAPPESHDDFPFVGRETQLASLFEALDDVRRGRTVVVCVSGESGAGKSTLVRQFLDEMHRRAGHVVLAGRCYEQESVPYKAVDSLIDSLGRYLASLPRSRLQRLLPSDMAALARIFPVLRRVSGEPSPATADVPDRQELRRRAFGALRELLQNLAKWTRLVLAIDDLQWGDPDSAALLTELLRPPHAPHMLLIASFRSEDRERSPFLRRLLDEQPTEHSESRHAESRHTEFRHTEFRHTDWRTIEVAALSTEATRELARRALGEFAGTESPRVDPASASEPGSEATVERIVEQVVEQSQGNPFFAVELLRHVRSSGRPVAALPRLSLDDVVRQRIEQLGADDRRLLELLAVAGQPLSSEVAAKAAELAGQERRSLAVLRAGHLVRTSGPRGHGVLETYHDRIRSAVDGQLAAERRREHHRQLASALRDAGTSDPETLARHFVGGDQPAEGARYFAEAAAQATQSLAFDRAAGLFELALQHGRWEAGKLRSLHTGLADALANAGRSADAAPHYLSAAGGATGAERLDLQRRAAMQSLISGHIDRGLKDLADVLAAVGMRLPRTSWGALAELAARRVWLWWRGVGFRERDPQTIPPEQLSRIDICWSASVGLSVVDTARGGVFQTRSLLLALRAGEPYRVARSLAWEAAHVANLGVRAEPYARRLLDEARALAERIRDPHVLGLVTLGEGILAYMTGRWAEARRKSEEAELVFRSRCTGVPWEVDTSQSFALWSLLFLGETRELCRRLPLAMEEARQRGNLYAATNLGTFVGHLKWLAEDDPDGGIRDLDAMIGKWSHSGFHVQHLTGLMGRTQIDLYRGAGREAWERLQEQWPQVQRSLFLWVQTVRVYLLHLRARSALAAAATGDDPGPLIRAAESDARRIGRENAAWCVPMSQLLLAGARYLRRDAEEACRLLRSAALAFESVSMPLFAATSRRRLGEWLGGHEGRELMASADAWLHDQGIRDPRRMTDLHVPPSPSHNLL